jgi:CheY-like chemotaxis protein
MMMLKIMLVDDNPDVIFSVKDSLESLDPEITVTGVLSGVECLRKVRADKPDLILMDIMMPGMDGWEVVARLKADKATSGIPIIYLTGKTDGLSKTLSAVTSLDYIEKPFNTVDLRERIAKVLKKK